jgi:hypothetical protein
VNAPQRPYRAYSPRPVGPEERDDIEILFGGLHWRAEKLIQAVFRKSRISCADAPERRIALQ